MVNFAALFTSFCGVCLTSDSHESLRVKETTEGYIYRSFHCGRRGVKSANAKIAADAKEEHLRRLREVANTLEKGFAPGDEVPPTRREAAVIEEDV